MNATVLRFIAMVTLALLSTQDVYAGDVVLITNTGINLSAKEVRDVYLGKKQFSGSTKLAPVDNAALQEDFLSKSIQMTIEKYDDIWIKRAFRDGLTAPAMKSGDAEVIEYVKRTPGAVGYVVSSPSGVNVVK